MTFKLYNDIALKRRSSVLENDIGSGGPLRRTRQKANLLTQRDKRELGYTALQQLDHASQKLLLVNESEPKSLRELKRHKHAWFGIFPLGYANIALHSDLPLFGGFGRLDHDAAFFTFTAESSDDDFWKDQEEWEIIRWRFHESSGVHTLEIEDGTMIHMLAERRYPLSRELMIRMLEHGMEVEDESETAITLIHLFILWTTEDGDNS
ncbi:hypothetical protein Tco_0530859 [Tanacetum coccineum]